MKTTNRPTFVVYHRDNCGHDIEVLYTYLRKDEQEKLDTKHIEHDNNELLIDYDLE